MDDNNIFNIKNSAGDVKHPRTVSDAVDVDGNTLTDVLDAKATKAELDLIAERLSEVEQLLQLVKVAVELQHNLEIKLPEPEEPGDEIIDPIE